MTRMIMRCFYFFWWEFTCFVVVGELWMNSLGWVIYGNFLKVKIDFRRNVTLKIYGNTFCLYKKLVFCPFFALFRLFLVTMRLSYIAKRKNWIEKIENFSFDHVEIPFWFFHIQCKISNSIICIVPTITKSSMNRRLCFILLRQK